MKFAYKLYKSKVLRLIPSRYPTVDPFDWAESMEEREQLAQIEGLTNDRLIGNINVIAREDLISGEGSSILMAPFCHPGPSRFSAGLYGIYYAADSLITAVEETKFHREIFLRASNEAPTQIQMREYTCNITKQLVDLADKKFKTYLNPDITTYPKSQNFANKVRQQKEWGLIYPSVRNKEGICFAIFRPPALSIPLQGCHLEYIWDGTEITQTYVLKNVT